MISNENILKAIKLTSEILENIPEPEKSLSFPIILTKILNETHLRSPESEKKSHKEIEVEGNVENFSGLVGGMKLLLSEGFFRTGKTQNEIFLELKRQGYHYPSTSLPITLSRGFMHKGIITRFLEDGKWRYVEKK